MSHVKLEKARIVGNILNSYSNKKDLVPQILTQEDFEKSLGEGDSFFEERTIEKFLQDVEKSEDVESITQAKEQVSKLDKKQVINKEGKVKNVFVKKNEVKEEVEEELVEKKGE